MAFETPRHFIGRVAAGSLLLISMLVPEGSVAQSNDESALCISDPLSQVETLSVKSDGTGDYRTITGALEAAAACARIEVFPGTYSGGMEVTKSVDIVGAGPREDIVVESSESDVVVWRAPNGSLSGLTIRQTGNETLDPSNAVSVFSGAPTIRDCDLSSSSGGNALYAHDEWDGTNPIVSSNVIHDSKWGIYLIAGPAGVIEDNDIFGNEHGGVFVASGADPMIRLNDIHNNGSGVFVASEGLGTIENNDIYYNYSSQPEVTRSSGIFIRDGSNPIVRQNKIRRTDNGITIVDADGTIEDNEIFETSISGIRVAGGSPMIRNNQVHHSDQGGMLIHEGGGTIENNDVFDNAGAGIAMLGPDADPLVRGNRFRRNGPREILVDQGSATIKENEFSQCLVGIQVFASASPALADNSFSGCGEEIEFSEKKSFR